MFKKPDCPIIAIEEHYWDAELAKTYKGFEAGRPGPQQSRLFDLDDVRIKEMDEAGIDIQVLSHGAPSAQKLPADSAVAITRGVNDRLAALCKTHPTRFAGFAALPTADPAGAADELERCVTKHGFKGAMLHGLAGGVFLDDKRFWPIYERAEKLDVPIYFHPGVPDARVSAVYYDDYAKESPMLARAAWGYTVETATTAIRMAISGVFDKHPNLKIIIGHSRRVAAVPGLAHRPDLGAARRVLSGPLPRRVLPELLDHHERQLLQPCTDVLRARARRRSYPVRGRLAVRGQSAGRGLDAGRAAVRRGQGQDPERERQAPAADVAERAAKALGLRGAGLIR